jgi:probable FeS assembly SUF system protein SufT
MNETQATELSRDCEAIQIPAGQRVLLPAGTSVDITQTLGGSYTVQAEGGLYQIAGKDADALGVEPQPQRTGETPGAGASTADGSGQLEEQMVWETLRTCYDPEIPVNIVDLGLVYDMAMEPLPSGNKKITVKMTLTAPGCGMGPAIAGDVQQKLLGLPEVEEATVELVWDPPWHQSMISQEGRRILGLE